jgi:exopolysaccharide biosynthesis WecB/TagA/CpsF family protein
MKSDKVRFLNIDILSISQRNLLKELESGVLYTPNIDHLVLLQNDKEFYDAYKNADWVVCDSRILYFISKIFKNPIKETIPGSSFFPAYYNHHKGNKNVRIFLLGAANGVADKARENINAKVGWNMVVGSHSPSFGFEKNEDECEEIINLINHNDANVLVVGVGAPKQEKWIHKYRDRLEKIKLFMGLGATIDFEANTLHRAPSILQRYGLEWLYRLKKEPQRLWKRYLIEDVKFFYFFCKQLLGKYTDPFNSKYQSKQS